MHSFSFILLTKLKMRSPCRHCLIVVTIVFSLHVCFGSFGTTYWTLKTLVEKQRLERWRDEARKETMKTSNKIPAEEVLIDLDDQYLTQRLDHFNPQIKATYQQRYWVNEEYWKKPNGPVFIFIGGEGPLSEWYIKGGAIANFAKKYGALLFAVEHRYYGESINDDGLETHNLQYLSSQQALADLAYFHEVVSKTYNLTRANRWISFGGSYPGALSAWFRIKYPHLVHASVASSAPVEALVNFEDYNNVVAASLANPDVGGSQGCISFIKSAFSLIDGMLAAGKTQQLAADFLSCAPLVSDRDVNQFVSNLAGLFMGIVQYNNVATGLNISSTCLAMMKPGSPYTNLVTLNKQILSFGGVNCSDNSWTSMITQLSNTTVDREMTPSMRQWIYQTCSQFGYYQTCDNKTSCLFSFHMALNYDLEACKQVYGITYDAVYQNVDFTNAYYGSDRPGGSRIIFVNGLIDPWHALSVLKNITSSESAILIPGTAHCADMGDDMPDDPPALTAARRKISDQIGIWLTSP